MARNSSSIAATDDERRSAFVCRVVEMLVDYGFTLEQIAREANASLDPKELGEIASRYRVKEEIQPLNVAAIRTFLKRHEGKKKAPTGSTPEILFRYINKEKRRLPSWLGEYVLLQKEAYLDPDIISDAELASMGPREAFQNFIVSASYRIMARMLGVDALSLRKTAKELEGKYVCVRASSRGPDKVVVSVIKVQFRPHTDDIWEYRHVIEDEFSQSRESDGMVLALDRYLIMLGDIASGHGLEMLVMERPGLATPNVMSGVLSTLSLSGKPVVGQCALFRMKDEEQPITGVFFREVCVSDLAQCSVIKDKERIEMILAGISRVSLGLPTFETARRGRNVPKSDSP